MRTPVIRCVIVHEPRVTSVQKRMEPRGYLPGASVDQTEASNTLGSRETLCPCPLIAANGELNTMNMPEQCADVTA